MKTLGDSHLIERGNSLKNNNIFLRIKQFNQENKCNLYKKTIFLYRIAVALRMECVDLSTKSGFRNERLSRRTPHGVRGFKLSSHLQMRWQTSRTPYGVRGFKYSKRFSCTQSLNRTPHGVCKIKTNKISPLHLITVHPAYVSLYNK